MKLWASILMGGLLCGFATNLRGADVGLIKVNGAIGPATATYVARAIDVATLRHDTCLVIELDTPGGLLDSTKEIVQEIYECNIPTVVYVTPAPGRAASAGTFITMAADIAAMAPFTQIGAAHPISIGAGGEPEKTDDVVKKKTENYTASFAESIARKRKRNADWAKSAVLESASITAEDALELKVIDLIAPTLPDLLEKINGRKINGQILETANATVVEIPMSLREYFLHSFLRPEVMFILMLVVIYGIIGELSSPGAILPGVAGAIALILVLYMSATLPINVAGLVLIGLAIVFFVVDIFAPTHGVLTFGGIIAFFLGALMLFNRGDPAFRLSLGYIIAGTLVTALFFLFIVAKGIRAQRLPVQAGQETMLGKTVPALTRIDETSGRVFIEGENWNAVSQTPVEAGQIVQIVGIAGLTLKVEPKPN